MKLDEENLEEIYVKDLSEWIDAKIDDFKITVLSLNRQDPLIMGVIDAITVDFAPLVQNLRLWFRYLAKKAMGTELIFHRSPEGHIFWTEGTNYTNHEDNFPGEIYS